MNRTTLVCLGLFADWLVHDLEEVCTMPATSRRLLRRLPSRAPIPDALRRNGIRRSEVILAVSMVGALVAAAALDGVRTRGRSWLFQTTLDTHGVHAVAHLAGAAATRSYTTGSVTSAVVVLPYWWWARRTLAAEAVPPASRRWLGAPVLVAALPVVIAASHAVVERFSGRRAPGTAR